MTLRIAIVGLDHWYAAIPFAAAATTRDDTDLVVIVDADAARAREIGEENHAEWTTDFEAVLAREDIDAVACFTSVDRSPDLCIRAARAGKHIVSVKPLALTLEEADSVVAAVDAAGVVFVPSESRRTSPLALRLSELVHDGHLGELVSGTFSMHSNVPSPWRGQKGESWWVDPARAPGGGWVDHAVYQIDRMNWLFDSPVRDVSGVVGTVRRREIDVEDYGHAVFTLESGAVVTIEDTWCATGPDAHTSTHLVGTNGSVHVDTRGRALETSIGGEPWTSIDAPNDTSDSLDVLVAAASGSPRTSANVRSARHVLELALRFYERATRL